MTQADQCSPQCLLYRLRSFVVITFLLLGFFLLCPAVAQCQPPPLSISFYPVPNLNSSIPSARCLHYAAQSDLNASFYIIAGRTSGPNDSYETAMNDVWSFSASPSAPAFLPQGSWQQQTANSPFPARLGLAGSSMTQIVSSGGSGGNTKDRSKTVVYLFGGISSGGQYLDDLWVYDTMPGSNDVAWSQKRQLSSARSTATVQSLSSPHVVQPSARALMSWQSMSLPYALLVSISRTTLSTPNLLDFLSATSGSTATETVFVAFGGRSDPSNNYSTTWSSAVQPATFINITSELNTDYADLWWYVASADTWIRVGNLTCLNNTYTCSDYKYMNDVVEKATGTSLNEQVSDITGNFTVSLRPDSLEAEVLALYTLVSSLNDTLYDTLSFLMSVDPSYETDVPNACAQSCINLMETPNPVLTPTAGCVLGTVVPNRCPFYFATPRTPYGIAISQQRPNATEGYSSGVYIATRGNLSYSIYYQFGGFSCAGQHPGADIFTFFDYDEVNCFSNTLYALDTSSSSNLAWWALTPPGPSSSSDQLLLWPSPRAYSAMAVDSFFGQLWLYGGAALLGGRWQYYSDLHVFDVVKVQWLAVQLVGGTPSGTYGMSMLFSSLYTNAQHLMLFGGCGGDSPTTSNQLYAVQTNWQLLASNWLFRGNGTLTLTAGQATTVILTAVVSASQPTPLLFASGLGLSWVYRWQVYDGSGNQVQILPSPPVVTYLGGGVYTFNFTAYQGRTATLTMRFYEFTTATYNSVSPAPFTVTIAPGRYSAHTTTLLYTNYSVVAKLLPTSITIQMRDTWNNPCLTSQGVIQLSLYYTVVDPSAANDGNQTRVTLDWTESDNRDGTYTITYTAPDVDTFDLYVLVNGQTIVGAPFQVTALDPLSTPSSIRTALLVASVTVSAVIFAMMLALIYYRNNRVVRAGSPLFLVLICLGLIISLVSVPVYAYPSNVSCRLFPFLLTTGYIVALSALFTKSYRVRLIFVRHQLHSMALTDSAMMGLVFVLVSCETILNLVWLISDPLTLATFQDTSVLTYRACGGLHSTAFVSASVAFNGLIALWGVWLALQIRHVPEAFSESKLMGAALYNLALVMAITIPLTWTASNTQSSHEDLIIPGAAILWCSFVTVGLVVAPKLYYILYPPPQHFFDGYPTSGVMVKGVKGRGDGHGPEGKHSWSDERYEAAELAGFDVRRGGAPPPRKWRQHQQGEPVAARRPGVDEEPEKGELEDGREGGEVEMRALKNSSIEQQATHAAAGSSAAPASMQPLMVEDAPAGFLADNRRPSLSDRRRPAPIRTTVPEPPAPVSHHQSARTRDGGPRSGNILTTPPTQPAASKPLSGSAGSAHSGGTVRLHSPAALQMKQSASSSPPSAHSPYGLQYASRQPTPPSQQRPSPLSRPSHHSRHNSSVDGRTGGTVVT